MITSSPLPDPLKRILLISPYWKEEHRWMVSSVKLAELWQRMGYHVTVVCMGGGHAVKEVSQTLTIHTRKDFFMPDPWNYGIAWGFSSYVVRIAKDINPDLIIVNKVLFWSSFALLKLRKHGFSVILTTDALVGITWWPRGLIPKIGAAVYAQTLGRKIIRRASRVVFFHPQPKAALHSLGIQGSMRVIPTGIDTAAFGPHIGSKDVTVTYVGRLESIKGVDDFLHVAATLKRFHSDIRFQVAGWYKKNHPLVRKYAHAVSFLGLRHDIHEILRHTDIFVLPSYSEGLSNALMEAMASGCACIATNTGGNPYLLDNGHAGPLFSPGDRKKLLEHLRDLIVHRDKRHAVSRQSLARIQSEFDWKTVAEKYDRLFMEFLS